MYNDRFNQLVYRLTELICDSHADYLRFSVVLNNVLTLYHADRIFIYEAELPGTFMLKAHFCRSPQDTLPEILAESAVLCFSELAGPEEEHHIVHVNGGTGCPLPMFADMSHGLLAVPAEQGRAVGLLGVAYETDRLLGSVMARDLEAVLKLISSFVKMRYFKKTVEYSVMSMQRTIDNTGVDIYVTDYETDEILFANASMAAPYGGADKILGRKCWRVLYEDKTGPCDHCPKKKLLDSEGNPAKTVGWDYKRPFDGAWFRMFSSAYRWVDGRLAHAVSSVNITENKQYEFLVEKMAFVDPLTGISNRRKFERDFTAALDRCRLGQSTGFVMFLDLDNFKYINDAFGHDVGDELLAAIAAYADKAPGFGGHMYRYGGDEFILLFEDIDKSRAMAIVDELLTRFSQPWRLKREEYFCTASIGIAEFPKDGAAYDVLLSAADKAMYRAKETKGTYVFSSEEPRPITEDMRKEFALRRAIADNFKEFRLLYHPFAEAKTGRWVGAEVLIRWDSPAYGYLTPDSFIGMCENLGLILPLGKWVLESAVGAAAEQLNFNDSFFLSVNISMMQLFDEAFLPDLREILERHRFPASRLLLEIRESVAAKNLDALRGVVQELRRMRVRVSLDGFGMGHSSLNLLHGLHFDMVKVPRSFVLDCMSDTFQRVFATTIAQLAHAADTMVCAEGVKNEEIRQFLSNNHYDYLQGICFMAPAGLDAFAAACKDHLS